MKKTDSQLLLEKMDNNQNIKLSLDIGGTLSKIVVYENNIIESDIFYNDLSNNIINELKLQNMRFYIVNSSEIEKLLLEMKQKRYNIKISITGGGAFKYCKHFNPCTKTNEFDSIVKGFNYVLKLKDQVYTINNSEKNYISNKEFINKVILLVNIGSGVSILKLIIENGNVKFYERISGTALGGGTFIGLCKLIKEIDIHNPTSYKDIIDKSMNGDNKHVDILVKDIYGNVSSKIFKNTMLTPDTIASCFGKYNNSHDIKKWIIKLIHTFIYILFLFLKKSEYISYFFELNNIDCKPPSIVEEERIKDIYRSFLMMITYNISQIVYLNSELHSINDIFFIGNFLKDNLYSMEHVKKCFNYWDKSKSKRCFFIKHDGFLGAIGNIL